MNPICVPPDLVGRRILDELAAEALVHGYYRNERHPFSFQISSGVSV
jgi:hypothetical protein